MFNFRIINTQDGNQIIDRSLKTPYNALTPTQMLEYMEMDNSLAFMDRMERKKEKSITKDKKGGLYKHIYKSGRKEVKQYV